MFEHTIKYEFSPDLEKHDIPKVKAFITYLQCLIANCEEEYLKQEIHTVIRSKFSRKRFKD